MHLAHGGLPTSTTLVRRLHVDLMRMPSACPARGH